MPYIERPITADIEASMQCSCGARFRRRLSRPVYPMLCLACGLLLVPVVDKDGHPGAHCPACHWPERRA